MLCNFKIVCLIVQLEKASSCLLLTIFSCYLLFEEEHFAEVYQRMKRHQDKYFAGDVPLLLIASHPHEII